MWLRAFFGWVIASLIGTASATAAHTYAVIESQRAVGAEIPAGDAFAWFLSDLQGMGPTLGLLIAIAFFIAFIAAGLLARVTGLRTIVFIGAGAIAVLAMHLIMRTVFDGIDGVAGARGAGGLALQSAAGAVGGLVFSLIKPAE